jgi:tetratricopeptide (TPR) repeat protein
MTYKTYPIFLSSQCKEGLDSLREQIFINIGKERYIYVDEKVKPGRKGNLDVVDELLQRIRESRVFVCILGGTRHGSPIHISDDPSSVSFFEIELFQASLLQKPIYLFRLDSFNPEPRLEKLLEILNFYLPEWFSKKPLNDFEIKDQVRRLINRDRLTSPFQTIRHLYKPIRRLVQGLHTLRRRGICFLDEKFEQGREKPNRHLIENVVNLVAAHPNEEKRLSRIWIGIRELMAFPYTTDLDMELLQYWNKLLGEWAKAGAWYGLHADTPLGCLAALNSVSKIRNNLKHYFGNKLREQECAYPGGALASAKYSIAKLLYIVADRKELFNEALDDIDRSMKISELHEAGLRAIRGSLFRQTGAISEAIKEYEEVLRLRQTKDPNAADTGEAMSELGFVYLRQLHFKKGLDYCKEGVDLLRRGARAGFLARGLRKLAMAYLCNGRLLKAYETKQEAKRIATEHGAFDQL